MGGAEPAVPAISTERDVLGPDECPLRSLCRDAGQRPIVIEENVEALIVAFHGSKCSGPDDPERALLASGEYLRVFGG
jgi:hypothetical protein